MYDLISDGCRRSAVELAPLIARAVNLPAGGTVLDVGCGEGWWAKAFLDLGYDAAGVDGHHVDVDRLVIPRERFRAVDLGAPCQLRGPDSWDLTVCLEVGEHLEHGRASGLVAELCEASRCVAFSAAAPMQGGPCHINEQPPAYWAALFASHGWVVTGALRWSIWANEAIEPWYRQNLLLAAHPEWAPALGGLLEGPEAEPLCVLHPDIYGWRTAT